VIAEDGAPDGTAKDPLETQSPSSRGGTSRASSVEGSDGSWSWKMPACTAYEVPYALADLVADMSDVVEVLSGRGRPKPSPRRVPMGIGARVAAAHCDHHVEGFHGLKILGGQVVVPCSGCRSRDRKLIDQEGTDIVRKLLGLALVAGIVVGVKKYLDNNPEANAR
jgi:hypothetical protein